MVQPHRPSFELNIIFWRGSEIVKAVRKACGPDFIIIYRLSMLDLIKDGSTFEEVFLEGVSFAFLQNQMLHAGCCVGQRN
jgi:hypothetical protein